MAQSPRQAVACYSAVTLTMGMAQSAFFQAPPRAPSSSFCTSRPLHPGARWPAKAPRTQVYLDVGGADVGLLMAVGNTGMSTLPRPRDRWRLCLTLAAAAVANVPGVLVPLAGAMSRQVLLRPVLGVGS
jgi:hypothetical protein